MTTIKNKKSRLERITALPKVLLHDHLDGGLRPETIIELADKARYTGLPNTDPTKLEKWFADSANSGSLEKYLETFSHTVAVMQTAEALERVAYECVLDLAADGVVYAEVRYAPQLHQHGGLPLPEIVEAVEAGFVRGRAETGCTVYAILCAMRHSDLSFDIARLVLRYREKGVVGFDIAGPEVGFPPAQHTPAFYYLRDRNARITIHAGEAVGLESIQEAISRCGAERLGHGVRIVDDITSHDDGTHTLGYLARYVRDRQIPLEVCPSSNVQTGVCESVEQHPLRLLAELDFAVTINTDNRLMSETSLSREFDLVQQSFGWNDLRLAQCVVAGVRASFASRDYQRQLMTDVIIPGWSAVIGSDAAQSLVL